MEDTDTPASAAAPGSAAPGSGSTARSRRGGHRRDVDGLRGLAIALVVVFHVFVGRVSSGVDVFLFLGGVFFFGPQIRNALNRNGLTLVQSALRIFRRLYPALVTVVTVTLVLALLVYSPARWVGVGEDAAASLLYRQNIHLAEVGAAYASISSSVSVFQHIWSMSVQLQIYIASLVVVALVAVLTGRRQRVASSLLYLLLVAGTVASFCYAVSLHRVDQSWNYYSPLSRFWEIGLGGLFGILVLGKALPAALERLRVAAGVVGVLLIICTGLFLEGAQEFPGPWTLVPLFGAALVILSGNPVAGDGAEGDPAVGRGVTRLLQSRPFQTLGRISYSLYLWHWPLLVLATYLWSVLSDRMRGQVAGSSGVTASLGTVPGIVVGTGVIVGSLLLAWLTERFIETPLRQRGKPVRSRVLTSPGYMWAAVRSGYRRAGVVPAVAVLVMVVATGLVLASGPAAGRSDDRRREELLAQPIDPGRYPGPDVLLRNVPLPSRVDVRPDPSFEGDAMPATQVDGCFGRYEDTDVIRTRDFNGSQEPCAYGDTASQRTVYLVGGSHSEHLLPALDQVGRERHLRVVPILKLGCVLGPSDQMKWDGHDYPECVEWDRNVRKFILDNPPTDGVFMTTTRPSDDEGNGPDIVPDGYLDVVRMFSDAGIHTWSVRDTPWIRDDEGNEIDPRLCVADGFYRQSNPGKDCGTERDRTLAPVNPAVAALGPGTGLRTTSIDLTDALCTDRRCPGVIGNVLVYRDDDHLTTVYAGMLAGELDRQMFGTAD
jgi:peptidoglycan/LPS O-acetylase OafA/YrhL